MEELIAYKKINNYTYHVGYFKNNKFTHLETKYNLGDALSLCGLMKIANPQMEIKEI